MTQQDLLEYLRRNPKSQIAPIAALFGISLAAVYSSMQRLHDKGFISKERVSRVYHYSLSRFAPVSIELDNRDFKRYLCPDCHKCNVQCLESEIANNRVVCTGCGCRWKTDGTIIEHGENMAEYLFNSAVVGAGERFLKMKGRR